MSLQLSCASTHADQSAMKSRRLLISSAAGCPIRISGQAMGRSKVAWMIRRWTEQSAVGPVDSVTGLSSRCSPTQKRPLAILPKPWERCWHPAADMPMRWVRERKQQRGADKALCQVFRQYGICAEGVILDEGAGRPDEHMFREGIRQVRLALR